MNPKNADKRLLVLHNNSGMSSVVDEIVLYSDEGGNMPGANAAFPNLILQDCKLMGDSCVLICRDLKEEDKLRGAPTIVATSYRPKNIVPPDLPMNAPGTKVQDMQKMASMINNLLSVFGFTYLVMNKPGKKQFISTKGK
ncbi:MAG TPA: hypothetical protein VK671_03470 [Mucilaginibacter sp.]|nr:hypothetical protein [Mucilaginibacter sp.]